MNSVLRKAGLEKSVIVVRSIFGLILDRRPTLDRQQH